MNQERIQQLIRQLLIELGEDPDREGLRALRAPYASVLRPVPHRLHIERQGHWGKQARQLPRFHSHPHRVSYADQQAAPGAVLGFGGAEIGAERVVE